MIFCSQDNSLNVLPQLLCFALLNGKNSCFLGLIQQPQCPVSTRLTSHFEKNKKV